MLCYQGRCLPGHRHQAQARNSSRLHVSAGSALDGGKIRSAPLLGAGWNSAYPGLQKHYIHTLRLKDLKNQSRLKFSIPPWNVQSCLTISILTVRIPTKIGVWWVARLKFPISLDNFKILIFFNLWALRVETLSGNQFSVHYIVFMWCIALQEMTLGKWNLCVWWKGQPLHANILEELISASLHNTYVTRL